MHVIGIGCLCISAGDLQRVQIFLKPFIGEIFTYKKHPIHRNSLAMVINMHFLCQYFVTDIKQTCLGQGLGVKITARKRTSKMKNLGHTGHTLPGRQNWAFANNSRCCYFKKAMQTTALNNWVNLLSKFAYTNLYTNGPFFQAVVWVVTHNIKAVMLDIPEPSMLYWKCTLAQARLSLCRTLYVPRDITCADPGPDPHTEKSQKYRVF